jgi:hypothetical protein
MGQQESIASTPYTAGQIPDGTIAFVVCFVFGYIKSQIAKKVPNKGGNIRFLAGGSIDLREFQKEVDYGRMFGCWRHYLVLRHFRS